MYKVIFYTHQVVVTLFLIIYVIKTILLLTNRHESLAKFSKLFKVPEMIVSLLFLVTGGYMLTQIPEINSFMLIKLIAVFVSIPLAVVGFKKSNKVLASLSLILIFAAYGLAEISKKRGSKTERAIISEEADGKKLYIANCASCHGEDGKLGLTGASDLSVSILDKTSTAEIIKKGKGTMVGFEGRLTEEQINSVAGYIETLRK